MYVLYTKYMYVCIHAGWKCNDGLPLKGNGRDFKKHGQGQFVRKDKCGYIVMAMVPVECSSFKQMCLNYSNMFSFFAQFW